MTKKESLFQELRELSKQYGRPSERTESLIDGLRRRRASYNDISIEVITLRQNIAYKEARERREAIFATEAGAVKKAEYEDRRNTLKNKFETYAKEITGKVRAAFMEEIPELAPYHVESFDDNHIYLCTASGKTFLRIELWFRRDYFSDSNSRTMEVNVASIGAVKVLEPSEGRDYYRTIGNIFSCGERIQAIYDRFSAEYVSVHDTICNEVNEIEEWLKNPAL